MNLACCTSNEKNVDSICTTLLLAQSLLHFTQLQLYATRSNAAITLQFNSGTCGGDNITNSTKHLLGATARVNTISQCATYHTYTVYLGNVSE
jgi:hypothetical protein